MLSAASSAATPEPRAPPCCTQAKWRPSRQPLALWHGPELCVAVSRASHLDDRIFIGQDVINWANFVSQCFNGLVLGALLALIASGLTIIYGTLGVLNLAHGAMFMLGGYAGWLTYSHTGSFLLAIA